MASGPEAEEEEVLLRARRNSSGEIGLKEEEGECEKRKDAIIGSRISER